MIRKKEQEITDLTKEIDDLELQLAEARSYLKALRDMEKVLPKGQDSELADKELRPDTDLARARDLIRKAGQPLHISKILEGLGKEVNRINKASLSGSLSTYVRNQTIFTRPKPNTFGLLEFEAKISNSSPKSEQTGPDEDKNLNDGGLSDEDIPF